MKFRFLADLDGRGPLVLRIRRVLSLLGEHLGTLNNGQALPVFESQSKRSDLTSNLGLECLAESLRANIPKNFDVITESSRGRTKLQLPFTSLDGSQSAMLSLIVNWNEVEEHRVLLFLEGEKDAVLRCTLCVNWQVAEPDGRVSSPPQSLPLALSRALRE